MPYVQKSVLVTLCNRHWLRVEVVRVVMMLMQDSRYRVRIQFPHRVPFENTLHHIVCDWMDEGNEDYWLSIDHDNPPMNNPLDLVALDKDVIGLPTPIWHKTTERPNDRPIYWNAYDWDEEAHAYREHKEKKGLQRVDAVGTGCVLFARRVFERPELRAAPFQRTHDKFGRVELGNDLAFAGRARAVGVEFWAHYGYPCNHWNELDLAQIAQSMGAQ